jgi:hypothetical protein
MSHGHLKSIARYPHYLALVFLLWSTQSIGLTTNEAPHPVLWPKTAFTLQTSLTAEEKTVLYAVEKRAKRFLSEPAHPVEILASAGKIDPNDLQLMATRQALQDADRAAILALAFKLSQEPRYFNKARELLLTWATVNQPTGNPIDETRLEGMIWAYDLIADALTPEDKHNIEQWLERLRAKKIAWQGGPNTQDNNHRTHQLKMLLLLDKVLGQTTAWHSDLDNASRHCSINLNAQTGSSLDYQQRNALYYHNYDLQAWLEISLLSGCCQAALTPAFNLLVEHLRNHQTGKEFEGSSATIDGLRSQNGFSYAKVGGSFDLNRMAPTIIAYYTLVAEPPPADLWTLAQQAKPSPWLSFLRARRVLLTLTAAKLKHLQTVEK